MRAFWYIGDTPKLDVFGQLPTPLRRELSARARQTLQGAADGGELRLAIAAWKRHTTAELVPLGASDGCFAFGGLREEPTDGEMRAVLAAARTTRPHILVFPELAFSECSLGRLVAVLESESARFPALIALGRAHRPRAVGGHENTAVILDASGAVLLEHEKMEPFSLADGTLEDIVPRVSQNYEYMDTPVGRVVVNVCRDVRSDVPMVMNRALGATLLIVPAYSKRVDFVLEEARVLGARQLAIVIAANSPGEDVRDGVALYVPIRGQASSVCRPIDTAVQGTVHAFSLSLGPGGAAKLRGDRPIAV
jgi:predicted amidohydrolase